MPIREEIDATEEMLAELGWPSLSALLAKRGKGLFVKGPLPFGWLLRVDVAPHALVLALIIKALIDAVGGEPVYVPHKIWQQLGVARNTRKRALDALERAGIIRTKRPPGQATRIWLVDKP